MGRSCRGVAMSIGLVACGGGASTQPDAAVTASAPAVDVLFVIDNSSGRAEEQAAVVAAFLDDFLAPLEAAAGGRPDLHVGVVSTDFGAGARGIGNCAGRGDMGYLQVTPGIAGCAPPQGAFLEDVSDGAGGRTVNYTGSIEDSFACIASLGTDGCPFERPIDVVLAALDPRTVFNQGFLRDGATLALVVVSDEDDCSVSSEALFDSGSLELGPLDSFRCFEHGVVCDPDDPRMVGAKTGCVPRDESAYFEPPAAQVEALAALVPDRPIAVALIAGDASPVEVALGGTGDPELVESCTGALGGADPAIRLHAFADELGAQAVVGSICDGVDQPLRDLAALVGEMIAAD